MVSRNNDIKNWYYCLIEAKLKLNNDPVVYIGTITDIYNRYCDFRFIKEYCYKPDNIYIFPIDLPPIKKQYAEIFETLLACVIKHNFKDKRIYSSQYPKYNFDITHDKIISKFEEVYNYKYEPEFYNIYEIFIKKTIYEPILIGTNYIKLNMPVKINTDGDVIMWN